MTARRPAPAPGLLLDWRDSSHWHRDPRPCRYCQRPTQLRDSRGKPADKVCAEQALAQQAADTAAAYQQTGHLR
ncbi:hypothetical protein [Streptomyces sp. NPDC047315]|uniref:hypothetical protein n=1 Tax=Streptomyces sp. NPDC047315 TaxID=3155142 RepID=UPI0033DCEEE1